jgi:hypothetical protein
MDLLGCVQGMAVWPFYNAELTAEVMQVQYKLAKVIMNHD